MLDFVLHSSSPALIGFNLARCELSRCDLAEGCRWQIWYLGWGLDVHIHVLFHPMLSPLLCVCAHCNLGTVVLKELFKIYMDSGMDWMNSSIVLEQKRKQQTSVSGSQHYVTFESLKLKHGEDRAKSVRDEKKALQRVHGNYQPDAPYWFKHPDWPNDEVPIPI